MIEKLIGHFRDPIYIYIHPLYTYNNYNAHTPKVVRGLFDLFGEAFV